MLVWRGNSGCQSCLQVPLYRLLTPPLLFCAMCYVIWFHSAVITALVHGANLGELGLKMRQIKGSRSGQSYSEHQTIYTLSKVYNHKDKPQSGKTTFFRDMNNSCWSNSLLCTTPGRSTQTCSFWKQFSVFKETELTRLVLFFPSFPLL